MSKGLALYWRRIPQRYNLIGTECKTCGEKFFPPRNWCPTCRRKSKIGELKFSGNGEIYSWTRIYATPEGFEYQKPYYFGIIKLDEGPLLAGQIVDCNPEDIEIGKRVKSIFRKIMELGEDGIIQYGYKFTPAK